MNDAGLTRRDRAFHGRPHGSPDPGLRAGTMRSNELGPSPSSAYFKIGAWIYLPDLD